MKSRKRRTGAKAAPPEAARSRESDEAERALGRVVSVGLPVAAVLGAIVAGVVASIGSALLVLAAGALVGTIALLWASVRTLSGDAPLPAGLDAQVPEQGELAALLDEKRRALRALKDLESEHALGKIDDDDYGKFVEQYREEAKRVMRAIDAKIAPHREKAEELARAYLEKRGLAREATYRERAGEDDGVSETAAVDALPRSTPERVACRACAASNEADAAFCKQCGASMRDAPALEKSDAVP
jgi:hypothetical protein